MVKVPVYNGLQVTARPDAQQGINVRATPGAFGADIGQGMQQLGRGMGQAAEAFVQLQEFDDSLRAKAALTAAEREVMEVQYGQNGFLTQQGRNAVEGRPGYNQTLEEIKKKHAAGLSGRAAQMFDQAAANMVTQGMRSGIVHSAQEQKSWASSEYKSRMALFNDRILTNFNDPRAVAKEIAAGMMEIDEFGRLTGSPPEALAVAKQEFTSQAHQSVAIAMASQPNGAGAALKYLGDNKGAMDAKTRMELETKLKPFAAEETALSVVNEFLGQTRRSDAPSAQSRAGMVGAAGPTNERARLAARAAAAGKSLDHVDGLDQGFATNLLAMFEDAPAEIRDGLQIGSGYRSEARQQQLWDDAVRKYGSAEAARKWVAPPGRSNHNHGKAVDIWYKGQRLDKAPQEVRDWVHANAAQYGLRFPMSWESWHIEPASARGGGAGSTAIATATEPTRRATAGSYDAFMQKVMSIEDPMVREAAMKQFNGMMQMQTRADEARAKEDKANLFAYLSSGGSVDQVPMELKMRVGYEYLSGLQSYMEKQNEVKTDPVVFRDLTLLKATNPDQFATVDLTDPNVLQHLSKSDLQQMIKDQGAILNGNRELMEKGPDIAAAMNTAKIQFDAIHPPVTGANRETEKKQRLQQEATFQKALLDQMQTFTAANGKPPTQADVLDMTNTLLFKMTYEQPGIMGGLFGNRTVEGRLYDVLNLPQGAQFDVQVEITDIPAPTREHIRAQLAQQYPDREITDEMVVQRYEDFKLGRRVDISGPGAVAPVTTMPLPPIGSSQVDMLRGRSPGLMNDPNWQAPPRVD